ncbi:hypothetical protein JQ604_29955 [Bradyrhizobium jicamae]|uniref:hypothetical protein n=1 Tax=Bradyrhizobium jicamae TaxID=280332 RepID=UPI001BA79AB9|nr:hypothetical protein [Bradyrhizobium jicamae]MBR0756423.1 hypothetical protein [Bradyrhizobium jicamae]
MLFELVVFGIILVAVGYWATMYTMGRRDDVIHGNFVQDEAAEPAPQMAARPQMPPLPARRPAPAAPRASRESLQSLLAVIKQDLKDAAQV